MKQSLTAMALCLTVWLSIPVAFAAPHGGGGGNFGGRGANSFSNNDDGFFNRADNDDFHYKTYKSVVVPVKTWLSTPETTKMANRLYHATALSQ